MILRSLQDARTKDAVRVLMERHDLQDINAAWQQLTPVERGSLHLCRLFDGTIISGPDPLSEAQPQAQAP